MEIFGSNWTDKKPGKPSMPTAECSFQMPSAWAGRPVSSVGTTPIAAFLGKTIDPFLEDGKRSVERNTRDQTVLRMLWRAFTEVGGSWRSDFGQEEKHVVDLVAILPEAKAFIRDQGIGFVFIHLPCRTLRHLRPHNRASGQPALI